MNVTDEYLVAHSGANEHPATEHPSGQVTEHLERLDKMVSMLADAAHRLEARLALVLSTEPYDGNVLTEVAAALNRVPVAERLAEQEDRLGRVILQLEDIVRRCEL